MLINNFIFKHYINLLYFLSKMDPNTNTQKIIAEVQNEFKDQFDDMQKKSNSFQGVYTSVMKKLDSLFRNKCGKQMDWLEANTDQTEQGPVLKDQSKSKEFEQTVNEFDACVKSNDVGSQEAFMDLDNHMHKIEHSFRDGYGKCVAFKIYDESKACFRNLFGDNVKQMEIFYNNFTTKFEALNSKL